MNKAQTQTKPKTTPRTKIAKRAVVITLSANTSKVERRLTKIRQKLVEIRMMARALSEEFASLGQMEQM